MITRRGFVAQATGIGLALAGGQRLWGQLAGIPLGAAEGSTMTIYKSASCGCCAKWVDHVKAAGFKTVVHDDEDMDAVKDNLGVPKSLRSCHTAQVDRYLIEGHVPAEDIKKLLGQKPKHAGLAVPGMPASSPGMAVPGEPLEPYEVLAFERDGTTKVYAKH